MTDIEQFLQDIKQFVINHPTGKKCISVIVPMLTNNNSMMIGYVEREMTIDSKYKFYNEMSRYFSDKLLLEEPNKN